MALWEADDVAGPAPPVRRKKAQLCRLLLPNSVELSQPLHCVYSSSHQTSMPALGNQI
jgi:hypothetical protein